jgi:hypothetical protein
VGWGVGEEFLNVEFVVVVQKQDFDVAVGFPPEGFHLGGLGLEEGEISTGELDAEHG